MILEKSRQLSQSIAHYHNNQLIFNATEWLTIPYFLRRRFKVMIFEKIFKGSGETFSAKWEAEKWLSDNGYSYGSSCVCSPQGVVKGDAIISKWRNMTNKERNLMDGRLYSDREGDARLVLNHEPT